MKTKRWKEIYVDDRKQKPPNMHGVDYTPN